MPPRAKPYASKSHAVLVRLLQRQDTQIATFKSNDAAQKTLIASLKKEVVEVKDKLKTRINKSARQGVKDIKKVSEALDAEEDEEGSDEESEEDSELPEYY